MVAMCGRYGISKLYDVGERFDVDNVPDFETNMNAAPTANMPVILNENGKRVMKIMRWGIPRFIGPGKIKDVFNTRADKAFHNWKKMTMTQRVLVPATGFYEWKKQAGGKQPYFIHPKGEGLFAFAGIWNNWKNEEGKEIQTYSIITTEPNKEMTAIHNRMPVILHKSNEQDWLAEEHNNDEDFLAELLKPYDDGALEMFTESKSINFLKSEHQKLMYPLNSK
jgi:putative SOS response-associated peptidase YedK